MNCVEPMSFISGAMRKSLAEMSSFDLMTFCSVSRFTTWPSTVTTPVTWSGVKSGVPTFTAITTSAQRSRTSPTGRLSVRPPSTSLRPSRTTGVMNPGTDMLARMAEVRSPERIATRSPLPMSVAMIASGSGSSSIGREPSSARTSRLKKSLSFSPVTAPSRNRWPSRDTPISRPEKKRSSISLRRRLSDARPALSSNIPTQSVSLTSCLISAGAIPAA